MNRERETVHRNNSLNGNLEMSHDGLQTAEKILGNDFLGMRAIQNLENWIEIKTGENVVFLFDKPINSPYSENDLKLAKNNERLILRPDRIKSISNRSDEPINLATLIGYLHKASLYSLKGFLIPNSYTWQSFFKYNFREDYRSGLSLVSKLPLESKKSNTFSLKHEGNGIYTLNSHEYTTWYDQNQALKDRALFLQNQGAKNYETYRRSITQICFDSLLFYANTSERLLEKQGEWGRSNGLYATFDSSGFNISSHCTDFRLYLKEHPAGVYSSR